jgi:RNA polymerase subunit RPABC4/transcription elongation factor Spt4
MILDDAIRKIESGLTTCEEVFRVFGPQNTIEIPCKECNSILEERYPYCPYCGASVNKICFECGKFLSDDWRFYPKCRTQVDDLVSLNIGAQH